MSLFVGLAATGAVASNHLLLPEMLRADFFLDPFYFFLTKSLLMGVQLFSFLMKA